VESRHARRTKDGGRLSCRPRTSMRPCPSTGRHLRCRRCTSCAEKRKPIVSPCKKDASHMDNIPRDSLAVQRPALPGEECTRNRSVDALQTIASPLSEWYSSLRLAGATKGHVGWGLRVREEGCDERDAQKLQEGLKDIRARSPCHFLMQSALGPSPRRASASAPEA